jgi:hypothetical protein
MDNQIQQDGELSVLATGIVRLPSARRNIDGATVRWRRR